MPLVFLSLSLALSLCLSMSRRVSLSFFVCVLQLWCFCLMVSLALSLAHHPNLSLTLCLSFFLSLFLSESVSAVSLSLSLSLSLCPKVARAKCIRRQPWHAVQWQPQAMCQPRRTPSYCSWTCSGGSPCPSRWCTCMRAARRYRFAWKMQLHKYRINLLSAIIIKKIHKTCATQAAMKHVESARFSIRDHL